MAERLQHRPKDVTERYSKYVQELLVSSGIDPEKASHLKFKPVIPKNPEEIAFLSSGKEVDILVTANPGHVQQMTQKWKWTEHGGATNPYSLRGLLTQMTAVTRDEKAQVSVYTSAEGFNGVMEKLGKTPGEDCFRLVENTQSNISARTWVGLAREGAIPLVTKSELLIRSDRNLRGGMLARALTPPEVIKSIKSNAEDIFDCSNLSKLQMFGNELVTLPEFSQPLFALAVRYVDGISAHQGDVNDRLNELRREIDVFCGEYSRYGSMGLLPFVQLGLVNGNINSESAWVYKDRSDPEYEADLRVKTWELTSAYVSNSADMLLRVDGIQGPPFEGKTELEKRREFVERLPEVLPQPVAV